MCLENKKIAIEPNELRVVFLLFFCFILFHFAIFTSNSKLGKDS